MADVQRDPAGAVQHVCVVLRNLQFVAAVLGDTRLYDKLTTALEALQEVKSCLRKREQSG